LAIETGIAPQYLIDADTEMIEAMIMVFKDRAKEAKRGNRSSRR